MKKGGKGGKGPKGPKMPMKPKGGKGKRVGPTASLPPAEPAVAQPKWPPFGRLFGNVPAAAGRG